MRDNCREDVDTTGAIQRDARCDGGRNGLPVTRSPCPRRPRSVGTVYIVLAWLLVGCAAKPTVDDHGRLVIYSPTGEPLSGGALGRPACADAIGKWFDRIDANHDGLIDRSEYLEAARRQFKAMDLDKAGLLTPSELAEYRAPYGIDVDPKKKRHGQEPVLSADDRPDPVMAADDKMRFEVSLEQFLRYQNSLFTSLPGGDKGRVGRQPFLDLCKQSYTPPSDSRPHPGDDG
jgi:hypothetical protein